jgi:hypothetical protein
MSDSRSILASKTLGGPASARLRVDGRHALGIGRVCLLDRCAGHSLQTRAF